MTVRLRAEHQFMGVVIVVVNQIRQRRALISQEPSSQVAPSPQSGPPSWLFRPWVGMCFPTIAASAQREKLPAWPRVLELPWECVALRFPEALSLRVGFQP